MKKTIEDLKQEIFNLVGTEYTILSKEYINNKTKISFKHNKCNKEFEMRFNNFQQGQRCPYCRSKKISKTKTRTHEEFLNLLYEKVNKNDYTVLDKYINNLTKIRIKHNKCGYVNEVTPNSFLSKPRCPNCSKKLKKTTESFSKEVFKQRGEEYKVVGQYINNSTKIDILHTKCNKIKDYYPTDFITRHQQCPYCKNMSNMEKRVYDWLEKNNIDFVHGFIIPELYYKSKYHPLSFDFKLEYDDGSLLLIECDGSQHFERKFNESEEDFKEQLKRDELKNQYCKNKNIELLRINYNNFVNIESILEDFINK